MGQNPLEWGYFRCDWAILEHICSDYRSSQIWVEIRLFEGILGDLYLKIVLFSISEQYLQEIKVI